ncbi:ABC transporter substrate-binding protein [Cochlodiniinecator piscidefendens]|uniref:ABC transporter substrate-binding protein n=1 Tax=Cochlodiniinecator piscidefendens TaxID=2715756 RepID=UPI00140C0B1D|nr:ABC transporter substrate-binding protein [Cochlodiniinecator piscidefendens]
MSAYNANGLTRRGLIKSSAALGMIAGLGLSSARAAPTPGGTLVVGMTGGAASDSLDPRTFSSSGHAMLGFTLGNCLTEIEENNELVGELAESWEASSDAKTWKFNLRQGVTFHNGQSMTSDDVVYSLNLHRGEDSTSGAAGLMGDIVNIAVDGPNAVVITLSKANADLPFLLSDFHLLIVPNGTEDFSAGVFTGPYRMEEFEPGDFLRASRNPEYWKADRAHVSEVEVLFVEDRAARISGLVTGELHMAQQIDEQAIALIEATPGVHIESHPSGGHSPILMHCDTAPFDNLDLRLAVKYSMDRQQIIDQLNGGVLGNDHPIPPSDPFYAADIPQRPYDPERAAFHVRESGFDGTLPLSISNVAGARSEEMATLFQQTAGLAGLNIEIVREPDDGFWSNVWLKKPFMIGAWGGRPTADIMLTTAYHSEAAWNDTKWRREQFDQIIELARGETDFDRRKALYHDAQLMIHEDGGAGIPFFRNNQDGVRDEVKGFYPAGSFNMSGLRAVERVWLES